MAAAAVLLFGTPAAASPGYPQVVYDETDAACAPPCTLCHETIRGGWETATKPFAQSLMHEGLVGDDEESLKVALQSSIADSDGDGTSDLDALRAGVDPSDASQALCPIEAGCAVPGSRDDSRSGPWVLFAVGLAFAWRRTRTARSEENEHGDPKPTQRSHVTSPSANNRAGA